MSKKTAICLLMLWMAAPGGMFAGPASAAPEGVVRHEPDTFDPYKPGAYLDAKTFHVPAGASFAWQAWESPAQQVGAILVNGQLDPTQVKIEHIELAHPSEEADSLVLSQYTLTVAPNVARDTILVIKTGGGADTAEDRNWAFEFVLHIEPGDKYMTLLKKLNVT